MLEALRRRPRCRGTPVPLPAPLPALGSASRARSSRTCAPPARYEDPCLDVIATGMAPFTRLPESANRSPDGGGVGKPSGSRRRAVSRWPRDAGPVGMGMRLREVPSGAGAQSENIEQALILKVGVLQIRWQGLQSRSRNKTMRNLLRAGAGEIRQGPAPSSQASCVIG